MSKDPNRSAAWLAFCVIAIAVAAAVGLWIGRSTAALPPEPAGEQDYATISAQTASPDSTTSPIDQRVPMAQQSARHALKTSPAVSDPRPPLPPDGTPLLDIFDELDQRAKQGDAAAACRLGAELTRCRGAKAAPELGTEDQPIAEMLARENASAAKIVATADLLMKLESGVLGAARICRGVDLSQFPNPQRYFHRAAMAGHVPSMLQFLTTTGNGAYELFDDPGLIDLYNRDGYAIFQSALAAGDPAVLDRWSTATNNPRDALSRLLPGSLRDPRLLEALREQIDMAAPGVHRAVGRRPDLGDPNPDQLERAEQMFQQYFEKSPLLGG